MKFAINVCDLSSLANGAGGDFAVQLLLKDFIDRSVPSQLINQDTRHNLDEGAVVLNGTAAKDEKRLNAFIELLQTHIGPKKLGRRVRCYQEGPRGGWKEVNVAKGGNRVPLQAGRDDADQGL
jgi:hypothetical protein